MKKCVTCGQLKDKTEFNYRNKLLGKQWGTCKTCQSAQRAEWYQKNKKRHMSKYADIRKTR